MKNSTFGNTGFKSSVRRSVSILLILATLAIADVAKAADSKDGPTENSTMITLSNISYRVGASPLAQFGMGSGCWIGNVRYQMNIWLPIYDTCPVFYPNGVVYGYGIVGN